MTTPAPIPKKAFFKLNIDDLTLPKFLSNSDNACLLLSFATISIFNL
jgi:hypothetical protein